MVYLLDPVKPLLPQLQREVAKEVNQNRPEYIVITASEADIARQFSFPDLTTILVFFPDREEQKPVDFQRLKEDLERENIQAVRGQNIFNNLYHSRSGKFRTLFPAEIMAATTTGLPESVKHCIESAVLVVDLKLVPPRSRVLAIAGSDKVPDTALLVEPKESRNMLDTRIIKIICYPYQGDF
jgi:hypothetical protein